MPTIFTTALTALAMLFVVDAANAQNATQAAPRYGADFATTPGPYARLNTGYSFGSDFFGGDSIDQSWIVGGGVGYRFSPNFRADVTFDYRPDFDQTTNFGIGSGPRTGLENWTLMANGYFDFNFAPIRPLVPYIGGGIGFARNTVDDVAIRVSDTTTARLTDSDKNQFAWQAMGGVSYYFTPNIALDVGYRYLDAGSAGFDRDLTSHEIMGAVRIGF